MKVLQGDWQRRGRAGDRYPGRRIAKREAIDGLNARVNGYSTSHDGDRSGPVSAGVVRHWPWPDGPFDLVVLSEVAYYLSADLLGRVMRRECAKLTVGATVVAAHWRHAVADYPLDGDAAHQVIAETPDLARLGWYRDADVVIEVFQTGAVMSVAERDGIPGAHAASQVQVVHDARH
jgi:hypothetical protein